MGRRRHFLSRSAVVFIAIAGCNGETLQVAPVSGVVTLQGKPIAGASVMFIPSNGGRPAMGETDESGKFRLSTFGQFDGALVGEHQVTVTKIETNSDMRDTPVVDDTPADEEISEADSVPVANVPRTQIKWLVPQHYSQPDTSGLSATVNSGQNELPLSLE